jgi:hypothetical protein
MLWTLFCAVSVVALLGLCYRHLRALRRLRSWAAPYLAHHAGKADRTSGSSPSPLRSEELAQATRELGWQLRQPLLLPRACAKVSFFLGAFAALVQAAGQIGNAAAHVWLAAMLAFAAGSGGALGCLFIGRAAEVTATRLREDWNALIRRSARDVAR